MKVFISHSGPRSLAVARAWDTFLRNVIQSVRPFLSQSSIESGEPWREAIDAELKSTHFGILCLTQDNTTAPWILYEAGALAKQATRSRVIPFLLDLAPTDVKDPLARFQARIFSEDEVRLICSTINNHFQARRRLPQDTLDASFAAFYPAFHEAVDKARNMPPDNPTAQRDERDMIVEVLSILRTQERRLSSTPVLSSHSLDLLAESAGRQLCVRDYGEFMSVIKVWYDRVSKSDRDLLDDLPNMIVVQGALYEFIGRHLKKLPPDLARQIIVFSERLGCFDSGDQPRAAALMREAMAIKAFIDNWAAIA